MLGRILNKLNKMIFKEVEKSGEPYTTFGIFGILNFPIYYLIWFYLSPQGYENLGLRMTATILCALLALHHFWPKQLKPYLPTYWYLTITFCLPFFFTFMLIKNDGATMWIANTVLIIFFLMLLVNWTSAVILLFIGSLGGIIAAYLSRGHLAFSEHFDYLGFFVTYFISIIIAAIFGRNREIAEKTKVNIARSVSDNIAHELRTPLAAINVSVSAINLYLPALIRSYQMAREHQLSVEPIRSSQLNALTESIHNIKTETNLANTFITMLLTKVAYSTHVELTDQAIYSIAHCVESALSRYPFQPSEKNLIHWDPTHDFEFHGDEILIIHVLFNLLKNALHYLAAAGKGEIHIWLEQDTKHNKLFFKDTGTGISPEELPKIFDRFYSKTNYGTGVGLAFCKMAMQLHKGSISVSSELGQFTQFVLYFPKIGS